MIFGLHRIVENDLFHLVAVGRAILATPGSIGRSSFVEAWPGWAYVEDKWLSAVLAAVAAAGGSLGLMLFQVLLTTLAAAAWYAMMRAWRAGPLAALAGTALALLACAYRLEPRPDTLSHACLATAILLAGGAVPWRSARVLLPALLALWVNLHGYFVNGLLVAVAMLTAAALGDRTTALGAAPRADRVRRGLLLLGASVLATLIHPQGWHALAWPVRQIVILWREPALANTIAEFQPGTVLLRGLGAGRTGLLAVTAIAALACALRTPIPSVLARQGLALVAVLPWLVLPTPGLVPWPHRVIFALVILAAFEVPGSLRAGRWLAPLLLIGFAIMAMQLIRNLTLLPPAALVLVAPAWTALGTHLARTSDRRQRLVRIGGALATSALVLVVAWARLADRLPPGSPRAPGWTGWGVETARFPEEATDFVTENGLPGPLLNNFDIAGHLLARLHPGRRVFISSNTSLYPADFLAYYRAQLQRPDLPHLERRFGVRTAVLDHASQTTPMLVAALVASPAWMLVHLDRAAAVFHRVGPDTPTTLRAVDVPARARALRAHLDTTPALPTWLGGRPHPFPAANLAVFLLVAGHPAPALAEATDLWARAPDPDVAVLVAESAAAAGRLAGEVSRLEDAARRFPDDPRLERWLTRARTSRARLPPLR